MVEKVFQPDSGYKEEFFPNLLEDQTVLLKTKIRSKLFLSLFDWYPVIVVVMVMITIMKTVVSWSYGLCCYYSLSVQFFLPFSPYRRQELWIHYVIH
jgi:hypothetical protein